MFCVCLSLAQDVIVASVHPSRHDGGHDESKAKQDAAHGDALRGPQGDCQQLS